MGCASAAAAWTAPGCFKSGREIPWARNRGSYKQDRCFLILHSNSRKLTTPCSVKLPNAEYFGDPQEFVTHLKRFSERLSKSFPESVREFPWMKAENMIIRRLLLLGEEASKWFLAGLFVFNFISDILLSISKNRELMIPLGLFAGVAIGDLMKETSQELVQRSKKNWNMGRCLLAIGLFFIAFRFAVFNMAIPGKIFLSHVSNGGLMQVLWLRKKLMDTEVHLKEEQSSIQGTDVQPTGLESK